MKYNKIVIGSIAVIAIALIYMWWSSWSKKPGSDVTIVTPMPVSGYSITDDGFDASGIAEGLPETLGPMEPALAVQATEIPTNEPDVISAISTAAAVPMGDDMPMMGDDMPMMGLESTTAAPNAAVETYTSYAPKNWNGRIL